MKENIHLFNEAIKEENAIRTFEKKLAEKQKQLKEMKEKKNVRLSAINEIRLQKIAEIDEELKESEAELERLEEERKQLLYAYCEKNGHRYVTISAHCFEPTGRHTFRGSIYYKETTEKCTVCGIVHNYSYTGYPTWGNESSYEQKIPEELYDDVTLRKDGKTYRMILDEIEKVKQYIPYLHSLYGKICELFGHDAEMIQGETEEFKCKCCKHIFSYREYINAHYRARFRNVVPFYYQDDNEFILSLAKGEKLVPTLPTYKVYQKSLKEKK